MDNTNYSLIRNLKIVILVSIPLYLLSSYLTGVTGPPIILNDGRVIDRGYLEHFSFLIISSITLLALLFVLHYFVQTIENRKLKFGIRAIFVSLILFGTVLLFCIFSSLLNADNKWGDFEFMLVFLTSVPLTLIFLFGLSLVVYGKFSSLYSTKRKNITTG